MDRRPGSEDKDGVNYAKSDPRGRLLVTEPGAGYGEHAHRMQVG